MHLFSLKPRLAASSAAAVVTNADGLVSRMTSGGGSQGGGSGLSGRSSSGGSSGSGGGSTPPEAPRSNRPGQPQGQEQSAGFQPEERYWTDYLRIALPVVGLLLMLGLFWYWASSIIGDNGKTTKPSATVPGVIISATAAIPTGTSIPAIQTTSISLTPTAQTTTQIAQSTDGVVNPTAAPNQAQTPPAGRVSKFKLDDTVVTNTDTVNLRKTPSTDGEIVDTLLTGTELKVIGENSVDDGTYIWIQVQDTTTNSTGYVADQFVAAP